MPGAFFAGEGGEVEPSKDAVRLRHEGFGTVAASCSAAEQDSLSLLFYPLGAMINFTVDLSKVGCGCNLEVRLTARAGRAVSCDADGGGTLCPEISLMEANNRAFQATPRRCRQGGAGEKRLAPAWRPQDTQCDAEGCGDGTQDIFLAYGLGAQYSIDTSRPFQVSTTFAAEGKLLRQFYTSLSQGDHSLLLAHGNCDFSFLEPLSAPLLEGMSLVLSYGGARNSTMAWLDRPPCGTGVCQGAAAGDGVISGLSVARSSAFDRLLTFPSATTTTTATVTTTATSTTTATATTTSSTTGTTTATTTATETTSTTATRTTASNSATRTPSATATKTILTTATATTATTTTAATTATTTTATTARVLEDNQAQRADLQPLDLHSVPSPRPGDRVKQGDFDHKSVAHSVAAAIFPVVVFLGFAATVGVASLALAVVRRAQEVPLVSGFRLLRNSEGFHDQEPGAEPSARAFFGRALAASRTHEV